ncbi:MAG: beta-propeller fold lactonase family protein [Acidimicrobiales bacterium]|jgi:RHS repeat-associated protein
MARVTDRWYGRQEFRDGFLAALTKAPRAQRHGRARAGLKYAATFAAVAVAAATLVTLPMEALLSSGAAAQPIVTTASEAYVLVSSPAEVETIDTTTGVEVGSPTPLGTQTPIAFALWTNGVATSELVVIGDSNGSGCVSEFSPGADSSGSFISCGLPADIDAVAVTSDYAAIAAPEGVYFLNIETRSIIGSIGGLPFDGYSPFNKSWLVYIAVNPDGEDIYLSQQETNTVVTLDPYEYAPYFQVLGSYTGNFTFTPTFMTISADGTTAYVSNGEGINVVTLSNGDFNSSGTQVLIDAVAGESALSPDGTLLYVSLIGSDIVDVLNTDPAYLVGGYYTAIWPGPFALSQDGAALALGSANSSALDIISNVTGSVENAVALDGTPVAVINAYDLSLRLEAFVAMKGDNEVLMLDTSDGYFDQEVSLGSGAEPAAIAVSPDGAYAYVADEGNNTVSVLQTDNMDTSNNVDIATVGLPAGSAPDAIAVDPTGDRVLVSDMATGELSVIDSNPNDGANYLTVLYTVYLDGSGTSSSTMKPNAVAISPDGSYAYVTDGGTDEVTVVSLTSPGTYGFSSNLTSLGFAGEPQDIAISPNDQTAYITDAPSSGNGYLRYYQIDPQNDTLVGGQAITVGQIPVAVALSPQGQSAYVTNSGAGTVSVVSTSADSVTATLTGASDGVSVAVTPDGGTLLTADGSGNQVSLWSVPSSGAGGELSTGSGSDPQSVAVSPMFSGPSSGEITGSEDEPNPSVAASGGLDTVDGVNTATGGYVLNLGDLSLPDIGLSLNLTQSYDSRRSSISDPFGYGWSFSYGMSLTQNAPSTGSSGCAITITQENGTPAVFTTFNTDQQPCPTSGYAPPAWEQASLSLVSNCYNGDACWDLTRDGTDQYLFDQPTGELVFEKNPDGNTITLAYSSGKLASVTGESGQRSLAFTWTGSNITEVSDSAGRTATLGYSNGYLTDLTLSASSTGDPTSHHWHFSYNSSNLLSDWWNPDNEASYAGNTAEATQITYNTSGQVTQVVDPDWVFNCTGGTTGSDCAPTTTFAYPAFDTITDTGSVLVSDPNQNYDVASSVYGGDGDLTLDRYVDGVLVEQAKGYGYELSNTSPYTNYPRKTAITHLLPDPFTWLSSESFDANGNMTQTTYDASGNTIETVDPMGRTTTYLYNPFNELIQKTDPMGYVTSYSYDVQGNELTVTDPDGDVTSYAYNSNGTKCAMLNANGYAKGDSLTACPSGSEPYETVYGYDAEGDQISVTVYDGTGNTVSNTYVTTDLYNSAGEQCASLTADGYAAGDRLPSSCPTGGAAYETVETAFDVFGNVLSQISPTNASGGTTTSVYDADGTQLSQTTPNNVTSTSTYDPDGHLCWTEPLAVSGAVCASPPTGAGTETTTYSYDPDSNQVSSVAPDGNASGPACLYETTSSFNDLAMILSETTPTGGTSCANETTSTTSYTYDADGNQLTSVVSPPPPGQSGDVTTTSTYDADSELCWSDVAAVTTPTCASPPTGTGTETTTYSYNADGQQVQTIPPDGNASGSPTNYATTSTYNGSGELTSQAVPAATGSGVETTTNYYDADGNMIAVTGPNGNPNTCNPVTTSGCADTTYNVYDEQNRELSTTNPSGNETQYTYDPDGVQLTETQSSSTGTYTYNGAGQVIQISYTDGTPTVSYQYTSGGQVCWMYQGSSTNSCSSPPSGATTYTYDNNGRLVSTTNAAGATVTYGYDASSNLACVSYPNSSGNTCSSSGTPTGVVRYTHNQENQLTSLTDWAGNTLTFFYNGNGQECWVSTYAPASPTCTPSYQNGYVTTKYSYDALGNVSGVQTTTGSSPTNLLNLSVGSRDANNDILAETPTVGTTAENTDSYSYNQTVQVASGPITGTSGSTSYAYLPTGSITADTTAFKTAGYTAGGALCWTYTGTSSNACTSPPSGSTVYTTNSSGERTGKTPSSGNSASYGWETESNRLSCANTNGTTCSTSSPTSTTTVYTYDGNGLRTSAKIGSTTTKFTWGSIASNSALLSDGTWDYIYAGGATPIEQIATSGSSPTVDLLLSDESGNVRGLVQLSSGTHQDQLVNYTDYDAYGNPITKSGGAVEAGGLTTPQTTLNANYVGSTPWGFGEGYTDSTGLVYLISRYYDPVTGQFLSVELTVEQTEEPYLYVGDDPVNASDPSGHAEWSCIILVTDPSFSGGTSRYGSVSIRGTQTCIGTGWAPEDIRTAIINPDTDEILAGWNVARPTDVNFVSEKSEVACKGTHRTTFLGVANGLAAGGTRNQYVESQNARTFACTP